MGELETGESPFWPPSDLHPSCYLARRPFSLCRDWGFLPPSLLLFSPISLLFFLSCPSRSQPSLSKFLVTIKKKSRQWGVERSHRPDTVQPCPCWPLLLLASAPRHPGCPSLEPDTLNCQGHGGPRIFSPWIQMTGWLGSVSRFWLRCGDGLRRVDLPS